MQLVSFLLDYLIPCSTTKSEDIQIKLVSLLDKGCNNMYRQLHINSITLENSLSSVCLTGLFQLSKIPEGSEDNAGKIQVALNTVPIMIARC